MRILINSPHLDIIGGVETYLQAIIHHLIACGHELSILSSDATTDSAASIAVAHPGIPIWRSPAHPPKHIFQQLKNWRPDVVFSHGAFDSRLEDMIADAFPIVLYAHNYHGTCISGTKCHSKKNWQPCEHTLGIKCLAAYFPLGCGGNNPLTMWRLFQSQTRYQQGLKRYSAIAVASRHMQQEYIRHGFDESRVQIVPLFPPNASILSEPPQSRHRSDRLLFLGRLTPLKGLLHLLDALPEASRMISRPLHLRIGGEGPIRRSLEQIAGQRKLSTSFLGWLSTHQVNDEMSNADLLVVPSLWPEPFGLVGIEAGNLGLPTAGYIRGGIGEWLIEGRSGEGSVSPSPKPEELAGSIVRALSDDDHWNHLRRGAWEVAQQFTPQNHLRALLPLLESVCR